MLTDSMIAERLRQSSHEFRVLEEAHHRLDLELIQLQKRHVLTPAEELIHEGFAQREVGEERQDGRADSCLARPRAAGRSTVIGHRCGAGVNLHPGPESWHRFSIPLPHISRPSRSV